MSYHGEPPLQPPARVGDSIGRIYVPVPTWPDLAFWRELAEQRERDLDAARAMICELTQRPTIADYNALVTELRRRGLDETAGRVENAGQIGPGKSDKPSRVPHGAGDRGGAYRTDPPSAFPLRALKDWR
jgi:hypothetical protein